MNKPFIIMALVASTALMSTPLFAKDEPAQVSLDGLELVEKDSRGELYADPMVDWSVYTQVLLDPASVSFRRNWQRDQNNAQPFKVRTSDMERIKTDLSELFNEVFTKELTSDGDYEMAAENAENVMRITPRIVDLDVYAPDTRSPGIQKSYTRSAGRMTLKLEIYDSVTGDLIATASDRKESPDRGYMQWTTSVSNRAAARQMFERWAKDLRVRLDEARAITE